MIPIIHDDTGRQVHCPPPSIITKGTPGSLSPTIYNDTENPRFTVTHHMMTQGAPDLLSPTNREVQVGLHKGPG